MVDDGELDLFSFADRESGRGALSRAELNRLSFAFLSSLRPFAAACHVPVRSRRLPVTCAGF